MNEWWNNPIRAVTLEFPASDVSTINVREIIQESARGGVNTLCVFATGYFPGGASFFQSKICPHYPGLGERDLLQESITAAIQNNQKTIAYIASIWGDSQLYNEHPDWAQIKAEGSLNKWDDELNSVAMCPNSPYRDHIASIVTEIGSNYNVDGFYFDEPSFQSWCSCKYCREKFMQETSNELPTTENWEDPVFLQFIEWRYRQISQWRKELYDIAKKPDRCIFFQGAFPLARLSLDEKEILGNSFVNPYAERFMVEWHVPTAHGDDLMSTARIGDIQHFELYRRSINEPLWWYGVALRYGSMIGKGRQILTLNMMAQSPFDQYGIGKNEIKISIGEILANGGAPLFARYYPDRVDQRAWNAVYDELNRIKVLDDYIINRASIKYAAIVFSRNSMDRFDYSPGNPSHLGCMKGFALALLRNHILFDIIPDEDLPAHIHDYQVLILPNLRCLSESAEEAITKFVEGGGGLVTSYESGFFEENGKKNLPPTLSGCLGINYLQEDHFWSGFDVYTRFENDLELSLPELKGRMVPTGGIQKQIELAGAKAESKVFGASTVHYGPLGETIGSPSITVYQKGKGKSVYFAFPIGNAYKEFGIPDHEDLILSAVRWVAREGAQVEVIGAPKTIALTAFTQPGGRTIIHLVNSVWNGTIRAMDEITHSVGFSLHLNTPISPTRIFSLPESHDLIWLKREP